MRTVFFGSSNYCLPVSEALKNDLVLIVTRPDKPVGRKQVLTPSPVALWAKKNNLNVVTPDSLKKDSPGRLLTEKTLQDLSPDLAIVADYGLIIPEAIFNIPKHGTFNIHFSRLPELRGPSPVQYTLLRGEQRAWITIFKLESPKSLEIKMDSGPILWPSSFPIFLDDTTNKLYTRLFEEAGTIIRPALNEHLKFNQKLEPQDHSRATYCRFLTRDDGFIPWENLNHALNWGSPNQPETISFAHLPKIQQEAILNGQKLTKSIVNQAFSPTTIYDFFRAVTPWPGMWTINPQKKHVKILKCHLENNKLVLDEIQFEGKKPESISTNET